MPLAPDPVEAPGTSQVESKDWFVHRRPLLDTLLDATRGISRESHRRPTVPRDESVHVLPLLQRLQALHPQRDLEELDFLLLRCIEDASPVDVFELAGRLRAVPTDVLQSVDRLAKEHLVTVIDNPGQHRKVGLNREGVRLRILK